MQAEELHGFKTESGKINATIENNVTGIRVISPISGAPLWKYPQMFFCLQLPQSSYITYNCLISLY